MDIYLHIGSEKTGTTTIQDFLKINRQSLLEHGVFIPKINHALIPAAISEPGYHDHIFSSVGAFTEHRKKELKRVWLDRLRTEILSARATCCILSNEFFSSRLRKENEVRNFRKFLKSIPGVNNVYIVIYIRPPLNTAISLFSTAVKAGAFYNEFPTPSNTYFNNVVNHRQTLELWLNVFGFESLRVRLFEKSSLLNMSLIDDFINTLALPDLDYSIPEKSTSRFLILV